MIIQAVPYPATGGGGAGTHRYWRLYHPYGAQDLASSYLGYGELEFMDGGGVDLTSAAGSATKAAASSFQTTGLEAKQAFDDSTTYGSAGDYNFWQASNGTGSWISWDFGAGNECAITRVRLYPDLDGYARSPSCVYVQYSDDNSSWTTDWAFSLNYTSLAWRDFSKSDKYQMYMSPATNISISAGQTLRMSIASARLVGSSGNFKIGFTAGSSGVNITKCRVGTWSGSAVAFAASPTPVNATFGGSASSGSQSAGTHFETDTISLSSPGSLMVAIYCSGAGSLSVADSIEGCVAAIRSGGDDTANNSPSSGYTYPYGSSRCIIDRLTFV